MPTSNRPIWVSKIVFTAIPAAAMIALTMFIIWGNKGLVRQMELKQELSEANAELAEIQRQNQRMLRKLNAMQSDSRVMERVAGEELNMGVSGARIIRFTDVDEDSVH